MKQWTMTVTIDPPTNHGYSDAAAVWTAADDADDATIQVAKDAALVRLREAIGTATISNEVIVGPVMV